MSQRGSTEGSGESLESKAGRLLFVGLPVTKLDRHWREFLREVRPGGVILFGRNVESAEQVALLNAQIRDAAGREVLIGVDQEGGLVDRFRDICEPMPSAKSVRNAGRADLAEKFGSLSARALRLMGFNINFAPVLDLVPFMALMFHRPGERLRSVMVSHAAFPDISEFLQDLFRQEGAPPTIQGLHQFPATISGNVTTRLLRRILKFDGLVITDDMEMGAVVQTLTVPEACLRAIEAGSDMVLICEHEENVVAARDELVRAVREQRLSMRAVNASVRRMDWAMKLAVEPEQFDAEEFETVSRRIAQLKLDL